MDEFNRDVLRIGRVRPRAEGEQAAAVQETLGHFAAGVGERCASRAKNYSKRLLRPREACFYMSGEFGLAGLAWFSHGSTDSGSGSPTSMSITRRAPVAP